MRNIYKFLFHPPSYGRCASNFKKIVFHAQPRSAWEDVCTFSVRGKPVQLSDFKKIYSSRTAKKKKKVKEEKVTSNQSLIPLYRLERPFLLLWQRVRGKKKRRNRKRTVRRKKIQRRISLPSWIAFPCQWHREKDEKREMAHPPLAHAITINPLETNLPSTIFLPTFLPPSPPFAMRRTNELSIDKFPSRSTKQRRIIQIRFELFF